jgi:hypothetical protein
MALGQGEQSVRRNASAATAGSIKGRGGSFGDFLRGALATRAFSLRVEGGGAPAAARGSRRPLGLLLAPVVALAFLAMSVPTADAATQRPFKEVFGSAANPTFENSSLIAVDRSTGDVLVGDRSAQTIRRFKSDGTPDPFAALGDNVIDGKEANGKPCAEEPASCDQTPRNGIEVGPAWQAEIAIDNSGGPTDGNIYITRQNASAIDIFGSDGKYLGEIDATGTAKIQGLVCGVAVDSVGVVYLAASGNQIHRYAPTSNVPVNGDYIAPTFQLPPGVKGCNIAVGSGPTADSIFGIGAQESPRAYKMNKETGELEYTFAEGFALGGIAVDPVSGNVLVPAFGGTERGEFDASGDSAVKVGRVLGEGKSVGEGFAVSNSGNELYAATAEFNAPINVFGAPSIVPTVTADPATEITGSRALLTGTVDPEGLEVTECFFEYGRFSVSEEKATCDGAIPTDSSPHTVRAQLSGLLPNGQEYQFRLVARNANGREESSVQTLVTANTVVTEAPSPVGATAATLRGSVRPEGTEYSSCFFEYGLASSDSPEKTVPCTPSAAAIEPDFAPHQVSAAIGGLQPGESYRFRLVASNSEGTLKGEELTFTTLGSPRIEQIRARDADQSSVTIEANVNPGGFGTSYQFEWGQTNGYGNEIPADFEPFIGSGTEPVRVTAKISGLTAGSVYHYRVVATNSVGTTASPDQLFETLNSCGLPKQRCFELVSPPDPGPVAAPGEAPTAAEMHFQAAPDPGGLAYVVEAGFPDSTRGAEVLYRGSRGPAGWSSVQISAPILAPGETKTANSNTSQTLALSRDLSCGVQASSQPLTADASTRPVVEAGGSNLYRRNPDGSYTAISKLTPTNFENVQEFLASEYQVSDISEDCGKIVFQTAHVYPGVPGVGSSRAYEWDEGELRNLGSVPGPSGEVVVSATPGTINNYSNVVADDGSRVFFSAERQTSPNPAEVGLTAVFVRENGTTRDVSLSETSTPGTGATYQYATADGSRVFFTDAAGLTEESSVEGTDLYEYNLETEDLTSLSVEDDAGGAQVGGFIGASADGTHVYFVAKGQLVPGKGKTFAQNQSSDTYSIYGVSDGRVEYAGTVKADELIGVTLFAQDSTTSRVSPDGKYLLFETTANVTGYESGGVGQAYLYSAEDGSTVCVSCRPDGKPSLSSNFALFDGRITANSLHQVESLVTSNGQPSVFFMSRNRLATGGVEGRFSLYEWSHGQVFAIDTEPPGLQKPAEPKTSVLFAGASADGSDLYFATPNILTWEDGEDRSSVYDARIGGGRPEPPLPPAPCDPTSEGSCQGPSAPPPTLPGAGSATFVGPGNAKPKKSTKRHKKHQKKQKHHKKQGKKQGKHKKRANGDRRVGK